MSLPRPPKVISRLTGLSLLIGLCTGGGGCGEARDRTYSNPSWVDGQGGEGEDPTAGAGGAPVEPTGGAGGEDDPPAASSPCPTDVAFRAAGLSFTEPTAPALAMSLGAALFGYEAHGMSLVVRGDSLTASATVGGPDGKEVLVGSPAFTGAVVGAGGIRSESPQASAFLRVQDDLGPKDLHLINVTLDARTGDDCSQVFVVLDAILPVEEGATELTFDGTTTTVADLAGGAAPETLGWQMRALYVGETISFDFENLDP